MTQPAAGRSRTRLRVEHRDVWEDQLGEPRRLDGEPGVEHVEDGIVLPLVTGADGRLRGGVLRADRTYVPGSRHLQDVGDLDSPANALEAYPLPEPPARRSGRVVFAGGGGAHKAYGHFLVEDLARLWFLFQHPEHHDTPVVFNNPLQDLDNPGFRLLELAGISRDRILVLDEPTAFDEVVVPDQALFLRPGSMHVAAARLVYDTIRDAAAPGPYEKVYLTYRQMNRTQLAATVNEEMIESVYERNGFTVVAPERLSVAEQIGVIAGAREIACTAGTLSHLVAFARDGVKLDVFPRDKDFIPQVQWSLNDMRSADVDVVDLLRPVLPSNARRGVIFFTSTPQWAEFTRDRFGSAEPGEPPADYVETYLGEWARLLGRSRKWALDLMPEWRASDLVESVHAALLPEETLSEEQRLSLQRRFYAPERRIDELESRLARLTAEGERTRRDLEGRLAKVTDELRAVTKGRERERERVRALKLRVRSIEASRSWRLTRPLRTVSGRLVREPRLQRPLELVRAALRRR